MRPSPHPRQRGAVAIIVAICLFAFVAVVGLVIDLGHLYIVKTELQNAADACALSAARELTDLSAGASARAKAAGVTVATLNNMDMQSGPVPAAAIEVTFSPSLNATLPWSDTVDANTVYARCSVYEKVPYSVMKWIVHWDSQDPMQVAADAVARPVGGQSYCAVPIAMCSLSDTPANAFSKGQWYSGRLGAGTAQNGNYGWVRFPGAQGQADLGDIIAGKGVCNVDPQMKVDAEPGVSQGVAQAWNTRFGLYSGKYNSITDYPPDRVGYAYTKDRADDKGNTLPGSWPNLVTSPAPPLDAAKYPVRPSVPASGQTPNPVTSNAYSGTGSYSLGTTNSWNPAYGLNYTARKSAALADPPVVDLLPYNVNSLLDKNGKAMNLPGNPAPLSGALHAEKGQDRRMVLLPIIKCSDWGPSAHNMKVIDYACSFMLHPVNDPANDVELEFRGLMSQHECGTAGFPGDFGPPVPALVK